MTVPPIPAGRIHQTRRDGELVWQLQCPACGHWGDIDDDQLHGRVSVNHGPLEPGQSPEEGNGCPCGCVFHETRDWAGSAEVVG